MDMARKEQNVMQINEIKMNGLLVKGDFVVDNTRNNLIAEWENLLAEDNLVENTIPLK